MNLQQSPIITVEHAGARSESEARLRRHWLLLTRGVWFTLIILTLVIFFASLPVYLSQLQTVCAGPACEYQQLTPGQEETLKGIGLSLADYAAFILALTLATMAVCFAVSTLIVWRRSDDRMALFVALLLVTLGSISATTSVSASSSPWQVPNECLSFLAQALIVLVFLLFPTGRFVPHWMRWIFVIFLTIQVPFTFLSNASLVPNTPVSQFGWLLFLSEMGTLALVQLYRYRRVSSPVQRQQTKWVVFGLAVLILFYVGETALYLIFPALAKPGSLYPLAYNAVSSFLPLFIPLSFGFAMLRYRLWDIDLLINRTLVYGAITVILTAVYVGLVIGLQALLRGLISQDNGVAIVISTLTIAALFRPLRQGIQQLIDRRFYRRKYDAATIVATFSSTLRQEVDLDQLHEQLLAVVQETMQPAQVSLWLRKDEQAGKPMPQVK